MGGNGRVFREGVIVGLIGFSVVAVFYGVFDLLAGRGIAFTLNMLGKVSFGGLRDPSVLQLPVPIDTEAMIAYNFLHLIVALAVGLFVASLVARVEDRPRIGPPVAGILLGGYLITVVVVMLVTRNVAELLPVWTIVVVNTLAAVGGGLYLWRAHPGLWERVRGVF